MSNFVPKPQETEEKKIVSTGFTKAELEQLTALANSANLSVAALIRQMVLHCLSK